VGERIVTQAKAGTRNKSRETNERRSAIAKQDILTLGEAAAYLRVAEAEVLILATGGELPGRKIAGEWRFLKAAVQDWLRGASAKAFWQTHAGALKDDPYLDQMLKDVYSARGRPMLEEQ
jgi:excisionase family DNA binding protein